MKTVTLDTNILPADDMITRGCKRGYHFAVISVTRRESAGSSITVQVNKIDELPETGVWKESRWEEFVWASSDSPLDDILHIISNGSFPSNRQNITSGQHRQLRDAMIFEAHVRENRDVFITNDSRGFVRHQKRDQLQQRYNTVIYTRDEFEALL